MDCFGQWPKAIHVASSKTLTDRFPPLIQDAPVAVLAPRTHLRIHADRWYRHASGTTPDVTLDSYRSGLWSTLGGFGWLSSVPSSSLDGRIVQRGDAGFGIRINWFFTWVNKLDQSRVSGRLKPGGHAVSGGLWGTAFVLWSVFGIKLPPTLESPVVPYGGLLNAGMLWIDGSRTGAFGIGHMAAVQVARRRGCP